MAKHTAGPVCPSCDEKLSVAHPVLVDFFRLVKSDFINAHISCSHRDEIAQENAFASGASNAHYPDSPHNKVPARAIDLFFITIDGLAVFPYKSYRDVADKIPQYALPIVWGGDFKSLVDSPHFEVASSVD